MPPLKFVLVGDGCVGCTSIIFSYLYGHPEYNYVPTVFDDYHTSVFVAGIKVNLEPCLQS